MGKESVNLGGGEGNLEDWKSNLRGGQNVATKDNIFDRSWQMRA
jgi:hypothetical protein